MIAYILVRKFDELLAFVAVNYFLGLLGFELRLRGEGLQWILCYLERVLSYLIPLEGDQTLETRPYVFLRIG